MAPERQGTIVDTYSYDPLGNVTSSTGSAPNSFTFEGMSFDHNTGFYYSGSGYYDPATGQGFGCKDKGRVDSPASEDRCGEDEYLGIDSQDCSVNQGARVLARCRPLVSYAYAFQRGFRHASVTLLVREDDNGPMSLFPKINSGGARFLGMTATVVANGRLYDVPPANTQEKMYGPSQQYIFPVGNYLARYNQENAVDVTRLTLVNSLALSTIGFPPYKARFTLSC